MPTDPKPYKVNETTIHGDRCNTNHQRGLCGIISELKINFSSG